MKILIAFVAGTSIALTALAGCTPSPEPTPTPTPTPSPEQVLTPSPEPVPVGRNPNMSEAEATLRAESVVTGETWLPEPLAIAAPAWAAVSEMLSYEHVEWYQLGERGGASIVASSQGAGEFYLFEIGPAETVVHVVEPSPMRELPPSLSNWFGDTIVTDGAIYYDSLATPATFTTPEGYTLNLREYWGSFIPSGTTRQLIGTVTNVGIYRIEDTLGYFDGVGSSQGGITSSDLTNVGYMVRFPFGLWMPVGFDPLGLQDESAVIDAAGITVNEDMDYVDLFDVHCWAEPLYQVLVLGQSDGQWTLVGATDLGPLYAPKPTNPVAIERHAMYLDYLTALGEDPNSRPGTASVTDFIAHGALLGTPSPDGRGWFVQLSRDYSPRMWC